MTNNVNNTLTERGNRYGSFKGHSAITQTLKFAMMQHKKDDGVTAWEVLSNSQREALDMIVHKIGRILNGDPDYADSWHDIAGYASLVDKELNGEIK